MHPRRHESTSVDRSLWICWAAGRGWRVEGGGAMHIYSILYLACQGGIVTSSSDEVGWIATAESKSALVAPILMATLKPCERRKCTVGGRVAGWREGRVVGWRGQCESTTAKSSSKRWEMSGGEHKRSKYANPHPQPHPQPTHDPPTTPLTTHPFLPDFI